MEDAYKAGAVCFCQKRDCPKIYSARVLFERKDYPQVMLAGDAPLLPCGHPVEQIISSAVLLRSALHALEAADAGAAGIDADACGAVRR